MRIPTIDQLRVKMFADGADVAAIAELALNPLIAGFTTNPTLMRRARVSDYRAFAREVVELVPDKPISFEVFADDMAGMERQALEIASWGENVYVKVPVTTTSGDPCYALFRRLAAAGVKLNGTALMTLRQVVASAESLAEAPCALISVFAGRVADTGKDPVPLMAAAVEALRSYPQLELVWASPREVLNIFQADAVGCHIITATADIIDKLRLVGKDLEEFSLETVQMFHADARTAGYELEVAEAVVD